MSGHFTGPACYLFRERKSSCLQKTGYSTHCSFHLKPGGGQDEEEQEGQLIVVNKQKYSVIRCHTCCPCLYEFNLLTRAVTCFMSG